MAKKSSTLQESQESSYDPSTMAMLESVVEEALKELEARTSSLVDPTWIELTRELLAHRVMARAARGEHDPKRLKEHALWGF